MGNTSEGAGLRQKPRFTFVLTGCPRKENFETIMPAFYHLETEDLLEENFVVLRRVIWLFYKS
jgi:hypothetical protein